MNKSYLWLTGMVVVGAALGVAAAAYLAKSQTAASPAASSTAT